MKKTFLSIAVFFLAGIYGFGQEFTYSDNWDNPGFTLNQANEQKVTVNYSIHEWSLIDLAVNREMLKKIELPGHFLPNDEGAPDLPGKGRFIAIPQGATAHLNVLASRVETLQNINISPAPRIPFTTDEGPLEYSKDPDIWNANAFYPENPVILSEIQQIRGVDVVMLGITPYQYNPVTKELKIYRDLQVEVTFEGGNGYFGEDRLRNRWWDPIMSDLLLNASSLPEIEYSTGNGTNRDVGCEYLIITPDDPDFLAWADTLKIFRNKQGISTEVVTTIEIGGNTVTAIESYVNNAYNTWDIVPAAILLLGDYGSMNSTIIAPIWDGYCASDNIYADVTGNSMPDIVFSRMTAQNATHLETMVGKIISYETDPPTNPDFYDHPITALGWQTTRWFQICIETVGGYFRNELGKNPFRINEIYDGNPVTDPWSTAPNTGTILNYFGTNGLGYLPDSPTALGNWSGGNASQVNNAINDGAFLLLHRDHGGKTGWGEPNYGNSNLSGLSNQDLTFVYSINCLTGKYNWSGECFAEAFHRHQQGALGVVAASEVSYSFVNDTYVWGAFDNMFPEFMPDYGSTPEPRGLLPGFSNAAGKYFLQQSSWPYNQNNKTVTYNLFHHHGGAFSTLYSEVPQNLLVLQSGVILGGSNLFTVQADSGSLIALSVDGEIIGVGNGTGIPENITIEPQVAGTTVDLVVTKTNYFRYEDALIVISPDEPYVIYDSHILNDENGNNDGKMDYAESELLSVTMYNIGNVDAQNVQTIIRTNDPFIVFTDSTDDYGMIPGNQTVTTTNGFSFDVSDTIPDQHIVLFQVEATDGDTSWNSSFTIMGHAPVMEFIEFTINDENGNDNGRIDPGETADVIVSIANNGSSGALNVMGELVCNDPYISINTGVQAYGDMAPEADGQQAFSVTADAGTPGGYIPEFEVFITADHNISGYGLFTTVIGQFAAVVIDMDPNYHSGPAIMATFEEIDLIAEYTTEFPTDLKDFKSVFICLGIHYSNHILTNDEAQILVDYLDAGGSLYMEGKTTWYDDPQTILQPMFNISVAPESWFVIENIFGENGTFTEGMNFVFDGVNPVNNYQMDAEDPAYVIFRTQEIDYGSAVVYDEGNYKTIGSATEFGGLLDGDPPSTKADLMYEYLNFFGGILTGVDEPVTDTDSPEVHTYPNPFRSEIRIHFTTNQKAHASLDIYNIHGQKVHTLFNGQLTAGQHDFKWTGTDELNNKVREGFYFYRLNIGDTSVSGKILLIR